MIKIFLFLFLFACTSAKKEKINDKLALVHYSEGTQQLVQRNYSKALSSLIKAHEIQPTNSKILNNLGMAFYFRKKKDQALKYLNLAVKHNPENFDALNNLASIYVKMGQLQKAKRVYLSIAKNLKYESQFRTYYNLGVIELAENNKKKAVEHFKESIEIYTYFCPSLIALGKLSLEKNSNSEALDYFSKSTMGQCHKYPAPHYYRGLTLYKLKDYKNSKKSFLYLKENFQDSSFLKKTNRYLSRISKLEKSQKL